MLTLLLALAVSTQAVDRQPVDQTQSRDDAASIPTLGRQPPHCEQAVVQVNRPAAPSTDLAFRSDGEAVAHYLLLERRVNGCSRPLIVNHRIPGSNAVGRELGNPQPLPRPFD
jgi:hypothetical protein